MREAMACESQELADELVRQLVSELLAECADMTYVAADYTVRQRIGYYAGHCSHETRDRVEQLFRTAHPIFGAIRYNGPPTIEQAAALGIAYGQATRDIAIDSSKFKDAWTAVGEIPRVDASRVACRPTGIFIRAMNAAGQYDSCDIATITCDSLIRWLRSRGGRNVWAESAVLLILGHQVPEHMRGER